MDRFEQVVRPVGTDVHVGVADDAEQVCAEDLDVGKQVAQVHANYVFEKREVLLPGVPGPPERRS